MTLTSGTNIEQVDGGEFTDLWRDELIDFLGAVDVLIQCSVISRTNTPAGSPTHGDVYLVGSAGTGVWTGYNNRIARYTTRNSINDWRFYTPKEGWQVHVNDENLYYKYNGTNWETYITEGAASSTDNAVMRFDGTTGKKAQNSGVLIDDSGNIIVAKTSGVGIKVDTTTPTYPWKDALCAIFPRTTGAGTPTLSTFRGGNIQQYSFSANDVCDFIIHIPHDYVAGTDVFIHLHWSHNGTAISGSLLADLYLTSAKGHGGGIFTAEVNPQISVSTPDIATIAQYEHQLSEVQVSAASPSASQLNTNTLEPDTLILGRIKATTIPTITGGSPNAPFFFQIDLHYQSTNLGTKNKSPNFYA